MMINHSPADEATNATPTYPAEQHRATLSLSSLLEQEIIEHGPMPFDQWMAHCLYHPQLGYYTQGAARVGREGDFFTSISVGQCFGMLLAHRIIAYAEDVPTETPLTLVEAGANTGQLALDILDTLASKAPALYQKIRYTISEPLESMRSIQQETLTKHAAKLQHIKSLSDLTTPYAHAIFLSNELIDAFPVKLLKKTAQGWRELFVTHSENGFQYIEQDLSTPELELFASTLADDLSEGYTTEFRPQLEQFTSTCSAMMQHGQVITIDYGFTSEDYYSEQRKTGTLRTFYQHKAGENPLEHLGEQDITAHVDFTQLKAHFHQAGFESSYFDTQSRYLTQHAQSWFAAIEENGQKGIAPPSKLIRQFQTLTHPSMMGRQFHVLECRK